MNIILTTEQVNEAYKLAKRSFERWQKAPGYYTNKFRSHYIGKLGEFAVEKLLKTMELTIIPYFRDEQKEQLCDIVVNYLDQEPIKIEIKTWTKSYWTDLGRCISVGQLPTLQRKCNTILWCVVTEPIPLIDPTIISSFCVDVNCWSSILDVEKAPIRMTGRPGMRLINNYQLDEEKLRNIDSLVKLLKDQGKSQSI